MLLVFVFLAPNTGPAILGSLRNIVLNGNICRISPLIFIHVAIIKKTLLYGKKA